MIIIISKLGVPLLLRVLMGGLCMGSGTIRCSCNFAYEEIFKDQFLVACYATLQPALSVRPLVRPSVTLYFLAVFAVFSLTAPAKMIK